MLQGGAARVESVRGVVIQKTADGGHVDVGETGESSGEVSGVVTRSEDAAELRVEHVLSHRPETLKKEKVELIHAVVDVEYADTFPE